MKKTLKIGTYVSCAFILTSSVLADDYAIVIAPNMEKPVRQLIYKKLISRLAQTKPGDNYVIINAQKAKKIATFSHNTNDKVKNPNKRFKSWLPNLKSFSSFSSVDAGNSHQASVNMPDVIDYLRLSRKPYNGVAIFGSPKYIYAAKDFYSMKDDLCPSLGHILLSKKESPYGIKSYKGMLNNTIMAWYVPDTVEWSSHWHKEAVSDFWTSSWQYLGGKSNGRYMSDVDMTFNTLDNNPDHYEPVKIDVSKPACMIQLREQNPIPVKDIHLNHREPAATKGDLAVLKNSQISEISNATSPTAPEVTPVIAQNVSTSSPDIIPKEKPVAKAIPEGVELTIRWDNNRFDLDLELKNPRGKVFNFRENDFAEFAESHDHPNESSKSYIAESYTLSDLSGWKAYVNVFSGGDSSVREVSGSLELTVNGKASSVSFSVPCNNGSHGEIHGSIESCIHWVELPLQKLLRQ